jgi:hypothetical protein
MGRFHGHGTARTMVATIAIAIVPRLHYYRRTRQACAGKMARTFSKPLSPAIFHLSLRWCIDRRPRKVSALFPPSVPPLGRLSFFLLARFLS